MRVSKILCGASIAAIALATSANAAVTADSEDLTIVLNGEVASVCTLVPDGTLTRTINMTNINAQSVLPIVGWGYSCNSPYKLTIQSANGRMENLQSNGQFGVNYDLKITGTNGTQTVSSQNIKTTPAVIDSKSSWTNVLSGAGAQAVANLDLQFPGLTTIGVAGSYQDTLTVTLKADF